MHGYGALGPRVGDYARPVLADWKLPSQEVHAVYPSPRQVPAKVIGFVECLQGEMGETWWSDAW